MEWLRKLLKKNGVDTELIAAIMKEVRQSNYIPKKRFDEVNSSLKETREKLAERDKQLKDFENKVKDILCTLLIRQ